MSPIGKCYDPEAAALPHDASKLEVVGYSLAAVASLPRRLVHPPPRQSKLRLDDVLAKRHCSPISLTDFEHYLTYTEHSVENLYFILWLQAYTAEYTNTDPAHLSESVTTAAHTYLEPGAPYEINLTEQNRTPLLALFPSPPPHPSVYDVAHKEVRWLLDESMRRWEKNATSNAGWRRLAFSTYLGFANACCTIAAMVIVRVYARGSTGRIVAACLTPWLWFAVVGVICGLKGVCFLCYSIGGTVRQVSSFELALPRTSTNVHDIGRQHRTASDASFENHKQNDEAFSPPAARGTEITVKPVGSLRRTRTTESKAKVVKLWAPMVAVEDPVVIRAHWESVVYGFLWSLCVAMPIGMIAAAA